MTVLLTGASSFTGCWFALGLARRGIPFIATLRQSKSAYKGLRKQRVDLVSACGQVVENCSFGDATFLDVIAKKQIKVLCHHGADVTDYKSASFDVSAALANNTHCLPEVLSLGKKNGLETVVLTGSYFQADEGKGDEPREAFSPYGLSKGLTRDVFRFWCAKEKINLTHFVIPNPFGPYEEQRFCSSLIKSWRMGQRAVVQTPDYVRDNIPVSLLSICYAEVVASVLAGEKIDHIAPSGYVETQGDFSQRMAREMGPRLSLACDLDVRKQTEFAEPRVRYNTDAANFARLGWDEKQAWDLYADYYRSLADQEDAFYAG